jgi:hypothetical protein
VCAHCRYVFVHRHATTPISLAASIESLEKAFNRTGSTVGISDHRPVTIG